MPAAPASDRPERLTFWHLAALALLMMLTVEICGRDLDRPVNGLHDWARAHGLMFARAHVEYGLGYTRGLPTWAVGNPPRSTPSHYLDHPPLGSLLQAGLMKIFGINAWGPRLGFLLLTVLSVPLLLLVLSQVLDRETALLATLFYVIAPVNGYFFWVFTWMILTILISWWCYLKLIRRYESGSTARGPYFWGLAISLFLMVQLGWSGLFYAFAIGSHYLFTRVFSTERLDLKMLAMLVIAPLSSFALDLLILLNARNWNFQELVALYTWRSTATGDGRTMAGWWVNLFRKAQTNFSSPMLYVALGYVLFGTARWLNRIRHGLARLDFPPKPARHFSFLWLILMPGILWTFTFTEAFWVHHYQQRHFAVFMASAAALGVMTVHDKLAPFARVASVGFVALAVAAVYGSSRLELQKYDGTEWYPAGKVTLYEGLKKKIPPDQALLAYEDNILQNHPAKGAHYRPEQAWYLNREVVQTRDLRTILEYARSGRYIFYHIEAGTEPRRQALLQALLERFPHELIRGYPTRNGPPIKAGMSDQYVFDLRNRIPNPHDFGENSAECLRLLRANDFDAAIAPCRRCVELRPADTVARHNLGYAYRRAGQLGVAIVLLENVARERPSARTFYELATAYADAGETRKAVSAYGSALAIEPKHGPARRRLDALLKAARGE